MKSLYIGSHAKENGNLPNNVFFFIKFFLQVMVFILVFFIEIYFIENFFDEKFCRKLF